MKKQNDPTGWVESLTKILESLSVREELREKSIEHFLETVILRNIIGVGNEGENASSVETNQTVLVAILFINRMVAVKSVSPMIIIRSMKYLKVEERDSLIRMYDYCKEQREIIVKEAQRSGN